MIRILLRGCYGRMGRMISDLAAQEGNVCVMAGVDVTSGTAVYPVFSDLMTCDVPVDVVMDFTRAETVHEAVEYCLAHHTALLVGTTGLAEAQMRLLREASRQIPVFQTSNLSMGIALLTQLCRTAAGFLRDAFDIEITETHHSQKADAPSGTALSLADALKETLDTPRTYVYGRQGQSPRKKHEIGIHALRGGTVAGEHGVHFFGHDESLTLSHTAQSRGVFAAGALRAAAFLADMPPGFYGMEDLVASSGSALHIATQDGFYLRETLPAPVDTLWERCADSVWEAFCPEAPGRQGERRATYFTVTGRALTRDKARSLLHDLQTQGIRPLFWEIREACLCFAVTSDRALLARERLGHL